MARDASTTPCSVIQACAEATRDCPSSPASKRPRACRAAIAEPGRARDERRLGSLEQLRRRAPIAPHRGDSGSGQRRVRVAPRGALALDPVDVGLGSGEQRPVLRLRVVYVYLDWLERWGAAPAAEQRQTLETLRARVDRRIVW